jgi:alkanesulfonate monooxygenase SsuD/methylene tetrahydromethanopterin reductase-like flavin-dependent oxidoreductase (luciferase family)
VRGKRAKVAAGDRPPFQGSADEVAADIRRYQALGVTHFVFDPIGADVKGWLAIMERFADEVRPRVQRGSGPRAAGP